MHSIGEAAKRSRVNIETIRYYEREGIVPRAERTASGRRLYDDAAIAQLRFVRRCRDLGFPIADIRALLELSSNATKPCSDVKDISARHLHDVRTRLADLRKLETALADLVLECTEDRIDCPVLTQLFADWRV